MHGYGHDNGNGNIPIECHIRGDWASESLWLTDTLYHNDVFLYLLQVQKYYWIINSHPFQTVYWIIVPCLALVEQLFICKAHLYTQAIVYSV